MPCLSYWMHLLTRDILHAILHHMKSAKALVMGGSALSAGRRLVSWWAAVGNFDRRPGLTGAFLVVARGQFLGGLL
jgi:hypothetical protein